VEARNNIMRALSKDPENEEAIGLLGIIELSANRENEALQAFNKIKLPQTPAQSPYGVRQLQILSEANYKRGLLQERAHNHPSAIISYEELMEFAQHNFDAMPPSDPTCRSTLQRTAYRLALLYENQNWAKSLRFYRISHRLSTPGSPYLSKLYNHFAKFLTRRVSFQQWTIHPAEETGGVYTPKDEIEEGLLLLLLYGETNEFKASFAQPGADYTYFDDLAIAYGKRSSHKKQVEGYERLLSLSSAEGEHWFSFASSLYASKQYNKAYKALQTCANLPGNHLSVLLLQAKLAINHMHSIIEVVINNIESTISNNNYDKDDEYLLPQIYHSLALSYSIYANRAITRDDYLSRKNKSIEYMKNAYALDEHNYIISFHLALEYADMRDILNSINYTRRALLLNHSHGGSWNLLCLLLSSQNQYQDALSSCISGIQESYDIDLLLLKSRLEHLQGNDTQSLATAQEALLYLNQRDRDAGLRTDQESAEYLNEAGTFVSERLDGESVTDAKIPGHIGNPLQQTKTDVGEDDHSSVWLGVAHIFIALGQHKDAEDCISQAKDYTSWNSEVYFYEGRLEEAQHHTELAIERYQKCLSIDPLHSRAMIRLGVLYFDQGKILLAERHILDCLRRDELNHEAWYQLGRVEQHKGSQEKASECFMSAVELERTAPIVPFSTIRRSL